MKIGVIGLGLIGGSIFKDLKALGYDVIGISKSQHGENIFDNYEVLKDRNLIFVCSAMNKTLSVLDELEGILSPDTIVTDVCSLKKFVCQKTRPYRFVPSHPMAGTEHKGFENSFEGLFKGAKWVITPCFGESEELVEIIKQLVSSLRHLLLRDELVHRVDGGRINGRQRVNNYRISGHRLFVRTARSPCQH